MSGTFTVDAVIRAVANDSLTVSAVISGARADSFTLNALLRGTRTGSFTIDAITFASGAHTTYRNRHERGAGNHFYDLPATLVELAIAIEDLPASTTLETFLASLDTRLLVLESASRFVGSFMIDAVVE